MTRRLLHEGRAFSLYAEDATMPDGRTTTLDVVRHPGAAAVVPFRSEDEVLLIRQFRYATDGMIWEIPAGKLDGEAPEICAARELEEEAGVRAGRLERLGAVWTSPGFADERIHLFAAFDLAPARQQLEHDEYLEVVPTAFDEALAMVFRGELSDGKSALALLLAARRLGRLGGSPDEAA